MKTDLLRKKKKGGQDFSLSLQDYHHKPNEIKIFFFF